MFLYILMYSWNNDGEYEDYDSDLEIKGIFDSPEKAYDALQKIMEKEKSEWPDSAEYREFRDYKDEIDPETGLGDVCWTLSSEDYLDTYEVCCAIKKTPLNEPSSIYFY